MNMRCGRILGIATAALLSVAHARPLHAQVYEPINSFAGCPPEGCGPGDDAAIPVNPLVLGADGNFYGTSPIDQRSWQGEFVPRGWGTVFRQSPGGARTILHHFPGTGPGGCGTSGITFGVDGRLYGVGARCGLLESDTIYRIDGTSFETVQEFPADQGLQLFSIVAASNGAFYGVGSQPSGAGVDAIIYKWDGVTFTALRTAHSTTYSHSGFSARLIPAPDGNLYFVASSSEILPPFGETTHSSAILRLRPDDVVEGVEGVDFGDDSVSLNGDLMVGDDGSLYATATSSRGGDPGYPPIPQPAGLYRLTLNGIFTRLTTSGRVTPLGAGVDGSVYFVTESAAIARLTPHGTEVLVHAFDHYGRISPLTRGRDGNYYGLTERSGEHGLGEFFRIRLPKVDMKANGADGPVSVSAGEALQMAMGFDAASDAVNPSEVYLAVVTPALQILWTTPSGFSLTPAPLYSGSLPSFPSTPLINIPDAAVLPAGDYYWVAIVDEDANGVPNGHYVDFVRTTRKIK